MNWLNKIVDELIELHPEGEIIVSSGVSPSGTYHVGTLREVLTADAVMLELRHRGRSSRHIHAADDLDVFRKIPAQVPESFNQYLGRPLCDVPSPDGTDKSYADFYLNDFLDAAKKIHLDMQVLRFSEQYRSGFMVLAIEKILADITQVRQILEDISGRQLDDAWSPIQVIEDGYLKKRELVSIDTTAKTIIYVDKDGTEQSSSYAHGEVKLDWRLDWPARWWLLGVHAEPFGRDHATKGGSYDTGAQICRDIFQAEPPLPVPYHFINRVGETKKMSKSAGNSISISELSQVLPAEVIRFFTLRYTPGKQLFFSESDGVVKLIDEFAELLAKADKSTEDNQLIRLCMAGVESIVSSVPFSHLVASYQAALKDPIKTLEIIARTEHNTAVDTQRSTIIAELKFIDEWIKRWAPEDVKFELSEQINIADYTSDQIAFFHSLADKISAAPADADGEWFHKAVYDLKDSSDLEPKDLFVSLYQLLIGKSAGPRAGWFLSILPRDWLMKRLRLEQNP